MAEMITVRAVNNYGVRVFQEEHPDHPNGAVDIWGNEGTHAVAHTEAVDQAIARGDLLWVDKPEGSDATQKLPATLGDRITRVVDKGGDKVTHVDLDAIPDDVDHVDLPDGSTLDRNEPAEGVEIVALIPHYDDLTVEDIKTMLAQLTPEERAAVVKYEAAHKNRKSLLS